LRIIGAHLSFPNVTFRLRPPRLDRSRFLAWAWAMLLVILISAAPDGGVPGSRPIGSAFDPATSAVAIGRQHSRLVAMTGADHGRRPLPLIAGGVAAAIIPAPAALLFAFGAPHRVADRRAPGDPRSLTRAHGARAPPAA
jgi:hypothetical protein